MGFVNAGGGRDAGWERGGGGGPGEGKHGGEGEAVAQEREWQDHRILTRQKCVECILSHNTGDELTGRDLRWR